MGATCSVPLRSCLASHEAFRVEDCCEGLPHDRQIHCEDAVEGGAEWRGGARTPVQLDVEVRRPPPHEARYGMLRAAAASGASIEAGVSQEAGPEADLEVAAEDVEVAKAPRIRGGDQGRPTQDGLDVIITLGDEAEAADAPSRRAAAGEAVECPPRHGPLARRAEAAVEVEQLSCVAPVIREVPVRSPAVATTEEPAPATPTADCAQLYATLATDEGSDDADTGPEIASGCSAGEDSEDVSSTTSPPHSPATYIADEWLEAGIDTNEAGPPQPGRGEAAEASAEADSKGSELSEKASTTSTSTPPAAAAPLDASAGPGPAGSEAVREPAQLPALPARAARAERAARRSESTPAVAKRRAAARPLGNSSSVESPRRRAPGPAEVALPPLATPTATEVLRAGPPEGIDLEAGETWADFLVRAKDVLLAVEVKDEGQALFEAFRTADSVDVIYATFARLFHHATGAPATPRDRAGGTESSELRSQPPWGGSDEVLGRQWKYPYEVIRLLLGGNWKAKKLWKLLDERCSRSEYEDSPCSGGQLAGRRAVVIGAGPCGLRAGIELRLLGARVTVVDRRTKFSRINQLHLWSWCGEELKALGARVLEPPPPDFGSNPDLLHVGISDLQKLLLKVALLLGVEVLLGTDFLRVEWDTSALCWSARLGSACAEAGTVTTEGRAGEVVAAPVGDDESPPSPAAPGRLDNVGALVAANGFGSTIGQENGLNVVETESLRKESAVGLICNFRRSNGSEERRLRSYSMAKQFYLPFFKQVAESTGADLENIVYTKGHESHYFVMTPTHGCLVEAGVIIDKSRKPMLSRGNIDTAKLDAFVRKVANYQFKADEPAVLAAVVADCVGEPVVRYADGGPRLFDFSKMRRHSEGITFVRPQGVANTSSKDSLLVSVVGDALIEPFWPEGLGIVRGFFSVLDASSAIAEWARGSGEAAAAQHFEWAYQQLKTLGAATRASVLRDDERRYALAPSSRYRYRK